MQISKKKSGGGTPRTPVFGNAREKLPPLEILSGYASVCDVCEFGFVTCVSSGLWRVLLRVCDVCCDSGFVTCVTSGLWHVWLRICDVCDFGFVFVFDFGFVTYVTLDMWRVWFWVCDVCDFGFVTCVTSGCEVYLTRICDNIILVLLVYDMSLSWTPHSRNYNHQIPAIWSQTSYHIDCLTLWPVVCGSTR